MQYKDYKDDSDQLEDIYPAADKCSGSRIFNHR